MSTVLSVSSILLVLILSVRQYELVKKDGRFFELFRTRLDRATYNFLSAFKIFIKNSVEFIHKDIVLYALHLVMYIALVNVRYVENRLEKVTVFIRSFRKKRIIKATSKNLRVITRENKKEENNEQNL